MDKTEAVRRFILRAVAAHPRDLVHHVSAHFGMSRQGVHRHVEKLIEEGLLLAEGKTRSRRYTLPVTKRDRFALSLKGLEEHMVWTEKVRPLISSLPDNVRRISEYGFTEILNNAIVHSGGRNVVVDIEVTPVSARYGVRDDGVGIFKKLQDELHLEDERHSILELAKGKLTTNPAEHTGEGIFFTTSSFDDVAIVAGQLAFLHTISGDWLIDERPYVQGTFVDMEIDTYTTRTLRAVFDAFTSGDDDYGFTKTRIPIFLAKYGDENLVSRSQAKRVVARLDRFREAVLDFHGVNSVGQAFADEIFRVFAEEHPGVRLSWSNANEEVARMIHRALGRT